MKSIDIFVKNWGSKHAMLPIDEQDIEHRVYEHGSFMATIWSIVARIRPARIRSPALKHDPQIAVFLNSFTILPKGVKLPETSEPV